MLSHYFREREFFGLKISNLKLVNQSKFLYNKIQEENDFLKFSVYVKVNI